jgi:hypothetical protein
METFPQPGTAEWLAAKASGPRWEYQDSRGVTFQGYMEKHLDHGGTDCTAFMRRASDGTLDLVSGSRLKAMRRVWS